MHPLLKKILDPPLKPTAMPHGYVMLMCPNKSGETAGHGCHYPGDMAVRMFEVLVRPWVGVLMSLALSLSYAWFMEGPRSERLPLWKYPLAIRKKEHTDSKWLITALGKGTCR